MHVRAMDSWSQIMGDRAIVAWSQIMGDRAIVALIKISKEVRRASVGTVIHPNIKLGAVQHFCFSELEK